MKTKISSVQNTFIPVLQLPYHFYDFIPLDLSTTNKALDKYDMSSSTSIQNYIDSVYESTGKKVAYGGYLEKRAIYKRSTHFAQENPDLERNIHLGMDIWAEENTPVIAPLSGKVHSFQNNCGFGDYGPTILLEHESETGKLYTLYGHLSHDSLEGIEVGQTIKKGKVFGYLGDEEVNGNYAPHLHFQVILDIKNYSGDYPGVCSNLELEQYIVNGIDPALFLNMKQAL